ncbi:MAG: YchE family NAAT transporter [Gammaproteobacteria bacterium]
MVDWTEFVKFIVALVAMVDPIGSLPIFMGMTRHLSGAETRQASRLAAITVATVLILALIGGDSVLRFFGISFASFRVAGGIILLLVAFAMLNARPSPVRQTEAEMQDAEGKQSVGVVPLGIPLLAGPGAIATVILYAPRPVSVQHDAWLAGGILLVALLIWVCFSSAPWLMRMLGNTGINISTRIMGLIIAAIGVEFMAGGLRQLFPGLG